ncbi:MAG: hypothetical protein GX456_06830 [Verrucomicrobia bacterium]|nr:hypothetical protein [Verrucomicrobiota bacterium]
MRDNVPVPISACAGIPTDFTSRRLEQRTICRPCRSPAATPKQRACHYISLFKMLAWKAACAESLQLPAHWFANGGSGRGAATFQGAGQCAEVGAGLPGAITLHA